MKELEAQIARAPPQHSPSQSHAHLDGLPSVSSSSFSLNNDGSHPGSESGESLAGTFRGLKLDEKGVVTYHGDTSFFHLPGEWAGPARTPSPSNSEDPVYGKRERLVSNAWQQRALEDLSAIPVSTPSSPTTRQKRSRLTHISRNHSNTSSTHTGAGFNPFLIFFTGPPSPVICSSWAPTIPTRS